MRHYAIANKAHPENRRHFRETCFRANRTCVSSAIQDFFGKQSPMCTLCYFQTTSLIYLVLQ
ncbi:hypothetical protein F9L69_07625 [Brucella melitensis]|uniref:Uncharacterized protein n=10 Tax=Brucella TaxID=234 RepID=Q2YPS3_BRUA2|nr:hypothetical protein BR0059 [Brucella suis 1330]AAX73477.1 hypothetical protein BruAb1_0059 [Brucella abortus bv. 1 str. 9-941]ABX61164.1 Hypothetical protein, conserved [Brucella canis ATCC 23365]ABY37169.1 Hypothetical protein, conserved [Brucella suis ATCC 23445]ACN99878.1 Hypothetical protein, conserved [Brucella melitensis ATCC 23457]ACU47082.1 hypothetical protein BMI_I62 [Brucella microti CCM 4915]AEK53384.1 hypothetical protein BPI_I60 [Brucella pinnipedialis B2/94]AEU05096.1 hypo